MRLSAFVFFLFLSLFLPVRAEEKSAASPDAAKAEKRTDEESSPLRYRRWFVPAGQIEDWPFGKGRYIPFRYDLFEQWVELLKGSPGLGGETTTECLSRVVLFAKLDGRQLVEGKGFFDLRGPWRFQGDEARSVDSGKSGSIMRAASQSIPLGPWGIWIGPVDSDGDTPISMARTVDDEVRLIFPADAVEGNRPAASEERNDVSSDSVRRERPETCRVHFPWSLRGRTDTQGRLLFDFVLPSSTGVELNLDLPPGMVPSTPFGIVLKETPSNGKASDSASPETYRRWRILLGRHSRTTLTISSTDETSEFSRQRTAIRQTVAYNIASPGVKVTTKVYFDRADSALHELYLDLESPLRPIEIRYGEKSVPWSNLTPDEKKGWHRIRVDLSEIGKGDLRELVVVALTSLQTDRPWDLPRIRIASQNVFWRETRCGVYVENPLLIRNLSCSRAVQVTPLTPFERGEVHAFQFFEDDAQITVTLDFHVPQITLNSFVQVQWGGSEISGSMVLDCSLAEGDLYTLEFPVSPHWTINFVESTFGGDDILFWDVVDQKDPSAVLPSRQQESPTAETEKDFPFKKRMLAIQLKRRPLRPGESLRFHILGRFLPPSQGEFRLADVSPLAIPRRKDESHFIAIHPDSPYHFQYLSPLLPSLEIHDPLDARLSPRVINPPVGTVFPLDSRTQETRFILERLKPNYSAEIVGTVHLKEREFIPSYRIRCRPIDSAVDRIYVHFNTISPKENGYDSSRTVADRSRNGAWHWSGGSELIEPIQVRRLPANEWEEHFVSSTPSRPFPDGSQSGEIWEVKLATPQTKPFELRVASTISLEENIPVPILSLPSASVQKGEIYVESPRLFSYHVVNARLKSIPIASTEEYRYQDIRAAFRYDPVEEMRQTHQVPLVLKTFSPDELPPSAWVWSLRLDTQFETEGTVQNNAVFLLENRGKESLRIILPDGVRIEDVQAVWMNDVRTTWHPVTGSDPDFSGEKTPVFSADPAGGDERRENHSNDHAVVVSLPEAERFVSVSLEYSFQDVPLTKHRKLSPRYPGADVPILSVNWTSWFPPEFDVSSRFRSGAEESPDGRSRPRLSKAMSLLSSRYGFDPFSMETWSRLLYGRKQRQESIRASRIFLNWMAASLQEGGGVEWNAGEAFLTSSSESFIAGAPRIVPEEGKRELHRTWARLFSTSNEERLEELLERGDRADGAVSYRSRGRQGRDGEKPKVRILVDRQSFSLYGISPDMPVSLPDSYWTSTFGNEIIDQNGLVLLVSAEPGEGGEYEYTFYITSFLMMAVHNHFQTESIGNCVRYLPSRAVLSPEMSSDAERVFPSTELGMPQWVPADQWSRKTQSLAFPWSISSQIARLASVTPDWIACEIPRESDNSLYIVHRNTRDAYHWLAFLGVIVLTWRRPFSSPIFLCILLVVFEILVRWSPPCYAVVPAGAFFGTLIALGFSMIRPRNGNNAMRSNYPRRLTGSYAVPDKSSGQEALSEAVSEDRPEHEEASEATSDGSTSPGSGVVLRSFWCGGLIVLFLAGISSPLKADQADDAGRARSVSSPSNGLPESSGSISGTSISTDRNSDAVSGEDEPYRIFLPTDASGKVVGNEVWIPEEFFQSLYRYTQIVMPKTTHRWSIARADYEGTLTLNPLTQGLAISEFKVVFDILLEAENATITLPALPLLQDGALWNAAPIQPTWRVREGKENGERTSGEQSLLVFEIENEKRGTHRLQLRLAPKTVHVDEWHRVSMEIPKVPNTTLRLNVPAEAPTINVSDCFGAVTPHSVTSSVLHAAVGPSGKLTFAWADEQFRGDAASIDVETLFWLHARPSQVDIRSKFRYRIEGGRIRHLSLSTDPRWQLSGQFHCEEYPIERVETIYDRIESEEAFVPQGETVQLVFRTPVTGPLTIRAGFVLKDFSGIGKIRLPQIRPLHSKVIRSMLAVSADPLLEFDLPPEGKGTGFESGWFGAQFSSGTTEETGTETVGAPGSAASAPTESRPAAEYDLTKISPSWTLAIRTGKTPPKLKLTQSFRFDYGDSTILCVGDFVSVGEMFQQSFSVPDSFKIESIEVRDAQNNPVEARWRETDLVLFREGEPRREQMIFFKRALAGNYSISVLGHFSSETESNRNVTAARSAPARIPLLRFNDVQVEEHRMDVYRTSAILAEVHTAGTGWSRSDVPPVVPKTFSRDFVVGSWKLSPGAFGAEAETVDAKLPPLRFPAFTLFSNRPIVQGETILTLSRNATTDTWDVTFDIPWDISQGELESLRFQWDERCGSILSVEPSIPWTLEQKNGRSELLLSPRIPFSGKQHFRIKAVLNTPSGAVSLPGMTPVPVKTESFEIKTFVILPREADGVLLPWNLDALVGVDEATARHLVGRISRQLDLEKQVLSSSINFLNPFFNTTSDPSGTTSDSTIASVPRDSSAPLLFYRAVADDFVAAISSKSTRPTATLYDVNLFVRRNGELFGVATFDLKAKGYDSFILTMPEGFELIQITSSGIASEGTRLMDRRWRIDLCSSDYPQRIGLIFRGAIFSVSGDDVDAKGGRFPFASSRVSKDRTMTTIPLPMLENVDIQETLWTMSFETNGRIRYPAFGVSLLREEEWEPSGEHPDEPRRRSIAESFGRQTPVSGLEAAQTFLKLDLVRLDNLLYILDSVPVPTPSKKPEVRRWYSQWSDEWFGIVKMIDFQTLHYPTALHSDEHAVLTDPEDRRPGETSGRTVGEFIDSMKVPELTLQALLVRHNMQMEKLELISEDRDRSPLLFSMNSLLLCRGSMMDDASHLFGAAEGDLREIRLTSIPGSRHWSERLLNRSAFWLLLPIVLVVLLQRFRFADLFIQFPHFWGMGIGILLWTLFPSGIWWIVILFVAFSLFRGAWPRHREFLEQIRQN